jgi:prolipoprotein diacylglyceryltransferase
VRTANFLNSEIVGKATSGNWGVVFESVDQLPRHPVQLYEAAAYLMTFFILLYLYQTPRGKNQTGLLFGSFLLLVFSARVFAEFFKVPQAAYEAEQILSVGQYLSLPFVVAGIMLILRPRSGA